MIKDIDYFIAIDKYKSISKAAKELYISQPALSKYLNNLETRLGIPLFERQNKKLILTKAGEYYKNFANLVSEQEDAFNEKLSRLKNQKAGKITIGVSVNIIDMKLQQIISEFKQSNPKCEIILEQTFEKDTEHNILSGILDFAISHQPLLNDNFVYQPIIKDYLLLVLPQDHPMNKEAVDISNYNHKWINLNCLQDTPFILPDISFRTRLYADEVFTQSRISPKVVITSINPTNIIKLVSEGIGAGIITENAIVNELSNNLEFYYLGKPIMKSTIGILYRKGYHLPLEAISFIKIFKKYNTPV